MWPDEPSPATPNVCLPGFARNSAITSLTLVAGTLALATSTFGVFADRLSRSKSRSES